MDGKSCEYKEIYMAILVPILLKIQCSNIIVQNIRTLLKWILDFGEIKY
jgi:hypothetical protein